MIEWSASFFAQGTCNEREAQVGTAVARMPPAVYAKQGSGLNMPGGFLECFADNGVDQGFAFIEVAGGLVEHDRAFGFFFDQQEFSVALDDRCYHHVRFPDHGEIVPAPERLRR